MWFRLRHSSFEKDSAVIRDGVVKALLFHCMAKSDRICFSSEAILKTFYTFNEDGVVLILFIYLEFSLTMGSVYLVSFRPCYALLSHGFRDSETSILRDRHHDPSTRHEQCEKFRHTIHSETSAGRLTQHTRGRGHGPRNSRTAEGNVETERSHFFSSIDD